MNDEIITPDQWFDVEEFNSFSDDLTEEVSVKTRMKLAISARRTSKRRAFLTKIRAKKRKGMAQLKRRARNQVRNEMKRRIGGTNWSNLSYGVRKRLDDIVSSCMMNFPNTNYDYVMVQGDTGSALGCALAAYNRKIKIIHLIYQFC